jgi:hypothetical protein
MVTHHELREISHNREEESDERKVVETPPYLDETIRILMDELQSCKANNERIIKEQEKLMQMRHPGTSAHRTSSLSRPKELKRSSNSLSIIFHTHSSSPKDLP